MLQVGFIREHQELVLQGLAKRNFKNAESIIKQTLTTDEERRAVQTELDNTLSESNKISKEIGMLFKSGERQKAELLKEKTVQLKSQSKELAEKLQEKSDLLTELLSAKAIY